MRPPIKILFAEDDENDRKLLSLARLQDAIPADFYIVQDGDQAIDYLCGDHNFADRKAYPFPDLVVVDLKMPRTGGIEVLKWIRAHPDCATLPVVILSGSGMQEDVREAYQSGANGYLRKPSTVAALAALLRTLATYWSLNERADQEEPVCR